MFFLITLVSENMFVLHIVLRRHAIFAKITFFLVIDGKLCILIHLYLHCLKHYFEDYFVCCMMFLFCPKFYTHRNNKQRYLNLFVFSEILYAFSQEDQAIFLYSYNLPEKKHIFVWLCPHIDIWMWLEECVSLSVEFNMAVPYHVSLVAGSYVNKSRIFL